MDCSGQEIEAMNTREESSGGNLFLIGLLAGTAIGAGLALAFAPRASELRERLAGSATDIGRAASRGHQRVADAVESATERAQTVRDGVADAIGTGPREVEQSAEAARALPGGWRS
jgi:gas vesicle protein